MKKIFTILFLTLGLTSTKAQINIGPIRTQAPQPSNLNTSSRASTNLYIDYSYLNGDPTSTRWSLNSYYTGIDSSVNYIGVAFDNICGYYDYANYASTIVDAEDLGFSSEYPNDVLLRYDSLLVFIAHENNSGVADTIIAQLNTLNTDNTISSNMVWADSVITSTGLSPGNTWSNGINSFYFMRFYVGYNTTAGEKLGAVFRYLNHNKTDTFGLAAGYVPSAMGGYSAQQSNYKNSFLRYPPFISSIARNSDIQLVGGGYLAGQNWVVIPRAEVYNTSMGILSAKGNLEVLKVFPNPADKLLHVEVNDDGLNEKIQITLCDIQGKQVYTFADLPQTLGIYRSELDCGALAQGLYQVIISCGSKIYTQRIHIVH